MYAIAPRSPFGPGFTLPWRPGREGGGAVASLAFALLALVFAPFAFSQTWPDKPMRLVSPYSLGGQTKIGTSIIDDGPDEVHLRQIFRMESPPAWKIDESPYIAYPRRS